MSNWNPGQPPGNDGYGPPPSGGAGGYGPPHGGGFGGAPGGHGAPGGYPGQPTPGYQPGAAPGAWQGYGPHGPGTPPGTGQENNSNATIAMWLGISSVVCLLPGPGALFLGYKARQEILAQPGRFKNASHATIALATGSFGTLLILIGLALPSNSDGKTTKAATSASATVAAASASAAAPSLPDEGEVEEPSDSAPKVAESDSDSLKGGPLTPLEELAKEAHDPAELESMISGNEWAFYPPSTVNCGGDLVDGPGGQLIDQPKRLDLPDAKDEFEKRRLIADREKIATDTRAKGALVVWRGTHTWTPPSTTYNFATEHFNFNFSYPASGGWPALGGDPRITSESFTVDGEANTGLKVGGKKVTVATSDQLVSYSNQDALKLVVKAPRATAETWSKDGVEVEYIVVQRFKGLGHHRVCKRQCLWGTCGNDDVGFGKFYRTEPVGHIIKIRDQVVSEKQPPAPPKAK